MRRRWHCTGELGFQPVGRRRDFYTDPTEDALLLTKPLRKRNRMGKKKDKLYKLEPETKAMIAAVRSAVEDCAATGLYGRFMGLRRVTRQMITA